MSLRPLYVTVLIALVCGGALSTTYSPRPWAYEAFKPPSSPPSNDSVAIVNCVQFHYEVFVGTVAAACDLGLQVNVYLYLGHNPVGERCNDALHALHAKHAGCFVVRRCEDLHETSQTSSVRAAVFVSAEADKLKLHYNNSYRAAIERLQPKVVLAVMHNAGSWGEKLNVQLIQEAREYKWVQHLALVALSESVNHRLSTTLPANVSALKTHGWILPTYPLGNGSLCIPTSAPCRKRFTVQGNIHSDRRSYGAIASSLEQHKSQLLSSGLVVQVVGGSHQSHSVPEKLVGLLEYHVNPGFFQFYDYVHNSVALLPAVASPHYLNGVRITSTVITSLITGVPMLADKEFIDAYAFLPRSMFYEQLPGEDLALAMLRVSAMSEVEHADVRRSLIAARDWLHGRSMLVLQQIISSGNSTLR